MAMEKSGTASASPLEQFVLLAKSTKGTAAVKLIGQVLDTPGVYVFGELLDVANIRELENSEHTAYYRLLLLFAYGTYKQYLENKHFLPELTSAQTKKLRELTIVTLAAKSKYISYDVLLQELDMNNVLALENLIIDTIYSGVITGKLDQKSRHLEVDCAIGRDVRMEDLDSIVTTLQDWCDTSENLLSCIEEQMNRANAEKRRSVQHKEAIEQEVLKLKSSLRPMSQSLEEGKVADSRKVPGDTNEKGSKYLRTKKTLKPPALSYYN